MCGFCNKNILRKQGHNTYKSVHLSLSKAIPLFVHYTGNTVVRN